MDPFGRGTGSEGMHKGGRKRPRPHWYLRKDDAKATSDPSRRILRNLGSETRVNFIIQIA